MKGDHFAETTFYDLNGKPRGYAFVEYEREKDLKAAYKDADGMKIDLRRGMSIKSQLPT